MLLVCFISRGYTYGKHNKSSEEPKRFSPLPPINYHLLYKQVIIYKADFKSSLDLGFI